MFECRRVVFDRIIAAQKCTYAWECKASTPAGGAVLMQRLPAAWIFSLNAQGLFLVPRTWSRVHPPLCSTCLRRQRSSPRVCFSSFVTAAAKCLTTRETVAMLSIRAQGEKKEDRKKVLGKNQC